jgi:hypothetical protein
MEEISGYNVNVQSVPQTDYQGTVLVGHSAQLNMQGVTNLDLTWSDSGCGTAGHASIVVTLFGVGGTSLTRQAYGRSGCSGENLLPATCTATSCTVSPALGTVSIARIKAMYGDTQLTASVTGIGLATQYYEITSTATSPDSGEARSVQVSRSTASVPSIFDYALFSSANLVP